VAVRRPRPVEVSGRGAPAPRSLADDVAELRRAATRPGHFPQAVTILGWTADRRLAYRALVCAHDELGGRGDSCDLYVCAVAPAVGHAVVEPSCEAAAAFELYGEPDFDAARTTAAAEEAVARLGPLTPGHARSTGAVVVAIEDRTLRFTGAGQPPQVLSRPWHEEAGRSSDRRDRRRGRGDPAPRPTAPASARSASTATARPTRASTAGSSTPSARWPARADRPRQWRSLPAAAYGRPMVRRLIAVALFAGACAGPAGDPGESGPPGDMGPPGMNGATGPSVRLGPAAPPARTSARSTAPASSPVTSATTSFTVIPGLTTTLTIPDNALVRVETNGGLQCTAAGAAYSVVDLAIFVDGVASVQGGQRRVVAANTTTVGQMIANWSFGRTYQLGAGTHTFEVRAIAVDPAAAAANVSSASAPQIQGVLTVTVLRR
jgi:hypothetical protein